MNKRTALGLIGALGVSMLAAGALAQDSKGDKRFDRLDTNGDGEISQSELAARDEERSARRAEMLEAADTDGNGSISRDEMKAFREAKRAERNPDKNGDGVVDRTEFINAAQERFDKLDKDGNGVLSEDEKPRRGRGHHRRGRG